MKQLLQYYNSDDILLNFYLPNVKIQA